jgi:hypothetical protein
VTAGLPIARCLRGAIRCADDAVGWVERMVPLGRDLPRVRAVLAENGG